MSLTKPSSDESRRDVVAEILAQAVLDLICRKGSPAPCGSRDAGTEDRRRKRNIGQREQGIQHAAG